MKVNFDGMRRNATRSMNNLHDTIKKIIENDYILNSEKEGLIEEFNEAAQDVDVFNCLEDENDENFNSMDDLTIDRLSVLEEDEDE